MPEGRGQKDRGFCERGEFLQTMFETPNGEDCNKGHSTQGKQPTSEDGLWPNVLELERGILIKRICAEE